MLLNACVLSLYLGESRLIRIDSDERFSNKFYESRRQKCSMDRDPFFGLHLRISDTSLKPVLKDYYIFIETDVAIAINLLMHENPVIREYALLWLEDYYESMS